METILFVCTHNSARSQMGEGLVNHLFDNLQAFSAGTEKTAVNPYAVRALEELGIDISHHYSKTIDEFMQQSFDYVVTVCDHAKETCPYYPHAKNQLHQSFEDPSSYEGSDEEKMEKFRRIRDEIKDWILSQFDQ